MKPTIGRIVEYTFKNTQKQVVTRPAIIVNVWSDNLVNLQVFTDGLNDNEFDVPIMRRTSVQYDEQRKEYHWNWMDYQKGQAAKTDELEKKLIDSNK